MKSRCHCCDFRFANRFAKQQEHREFEKRQVHSRAASKFPREFSQLPENNLAWTFDLLYKIGLYFQRKSSHDLTTATACEPRSSSADITV